MKIVNQKFHRQIKSTFCQINQASTFSMLLFLGIALLFLTPDRAQAQNVKYKVWVTNGDNGANNTPWIKFRGTKNQNEPWEKIEHFVMDNPGNDHQPNTVDYYEFHLSGSKDFGLIKEINIEGDKGRDWQVNKVVVEREVIGKPNPNPFQSVFTAYRNVLIYGDWIPFEADNIDEMKQEVIKESKPRTVTTRMYTGVYKDRRNSPKGQAMSRTVSTTFQATKGFTLSKGSTKSQEDSWNFGIEQTVEAGLPVVSTSTTFKFDVGSVISEEQTQEASENDETVLTQSFEETNYYEKGLLTFTIYPATLTKEIRTIKMLGETYEVEGLSQTNPFSIGNDIEFQFEKGEPVPPQLKLIAEGKMDFAKAKVFLDNYDKITNPTGEVKSYAKISIGIPRMPHCLLGGGMHTNPTPHLGPYSNQFKYEDRGEVYVFNYLTQGLGQNLAWNFIPTEDDDGYYYIIDAKFNKALVVADDRPDVEFYHKDQRGDNAKWKLEPCPESLGKNIFYITDKKYGKSLVRKKSDAYTPLLHQKHNGQANAAWVLGFGNDTGSVPTEIK